MTYLPITEDPPTIDAVAAARREEVGVSHPGDAAVSSSNSITAHRARTMVVDSTALWVEDVPEVVMLGEEIVGDRPRYTLLV